MWFYTLIFWLLCIVAAAHIAEERGHRDLVGIASGALLGPLGVLIMALLPADEQGVARRQLARGHRQRCPHCAELVLSQANVCRYCGRDIHRPSIAQP